MNSHEMISRTGGWTDGRSPADRAIVMLGCLGATVTMLAVTLIAAITHTGALWLVFAPIGAVMFAIGAWRAWLRVAAHGYFHDGDEEDEDESPEGGSGVRFPPDAPDGGGSLEFDWDAFVTGFWEHVDATSRDAALR